ncbi:MAG: aminotransferase class IV [Cyclobacteriaceae bacterium]
MSRFIESICFDEKEYKLLDIHQERINQTFREFYPLTIPFDISSQLPKLDFSERHKVRVVYSNESVDIEVVKYTPQEIKSLKLIETASIDYKYKYEDRKLLKKLYSLKGDADDIIIVKEGWITDSSYANLALWDGSKWFTPRTHLLNGVKRQFYLRYGLISEKNIPAANIHDFEKISLINAMLDLGDLEVDLVNVEF